MSRRSIALALIVVFAAGCGGGHEKSGVKTTRAGSAGTGRGGSGNASSGTGALMSGATTLHGRAASTLSQFVNAPVQARGIRVLSVVGSDAFWVGGSKADRFLVHLHGPAPPTVRAGDRATFTGTLKKNSGTYGVSGSDAALLQREGVHVEANAGTLRLTH
jgi:hypothetical protein